MPISQCRLITFWVGVIWCRKDLLLMGGRSPKYIPELIAIITILHYSNSNLLTRACLLCNITKYPHVIGTAVMDNSRGRVVRPLGALLFANHQHRPNKDWHWKILISINWSCTGELIRLKSPVYASRDIPVVSDTVSEGNTSPVIKMILRPPSANERVNGWTSEQAQSTVAECRTNGSGW